VPSKKCIFICLDGLGDRYQDELQGTPLQAAHTPHLDCLAAKGANGLFHADQLGVPLSSPAAHLAIYGYDWAEIPARSVLEALALGISTDSEDCLVLARLGCGENRDGKLIVLDREPECSPEELAEFLEAIREFESSGITFELFQISGIKLVLKMKGLVSPFVTDSDTFRAKMPLAQIKPLDGFQADPAALNTANALREYVAWSFRKLSDHHMNRKRIERGQHPINVVSTYFAGKMPAIGSFTDKWGMRALSISTKPVQWGIAKLIGMDTVKAKKTGDAESDIADRIQIALSKLSEYDFFHVHTMAPDVAAHTKDPNHKKEIIEALDRGIGRSIGPVLEDQRVLIVVTSDHSTPSSGSLIHSGEPVPVMFIGGGARRDNVERFNEVACAGGSLGLVRGKELMSLILDQLDRSLMKDIRYTSSPIQYWSEEYECFKLK
jgi:2,3-bisphosphoglycerate-independent phosphoglycerate mutase